MADQEVLDVTLQVARTLSAIGLDYVVGGSLASSMHGIPRSTQDVDILVFMAHDDVEPWLAEERNRRQSVGITDSGESVDVSSAEDNILHKLKWYQKGGEVSEQQWRDVLGVMKVQGEELDLSYLDQWARRLGLEDLLEQALTDAGLAGGES